MTKTVAIVGAGIMGRVLAMDFLQQGFQVSIFDKESRDSTSACSFVGAGMLTPFSEAETAEPLIHDLGLEAFDRWQRVCDVLSTDCLKSGGSLIVAHPNDRVDLQRFIQGVKSHLEITEAVFQEVDRLAIERLEPELGQRFHQGVYLPRESWIVTEQILMAMSDYLNSHPQVAWHECAMVESIRPHQITISGKVQAFDWVMDCRGLGAKEDIPELRGVRGELIWLHAPEVKLNRLVRLIHPRYRIYVIPRPNDHYIIGATQLESEDYGAITVRSTLELLSAAYTVHRGFGEGRVVKTATHCRPAMPDNLPVVYCDNGLIRVNGLFRHGYLLSPSISKRVVDYVVNDQVDPRFMVRNENFSEILNKKKKLAGSFELN